MSKRNRINRTFDESYQMRRSIAGHGHGYYPRIHPQYYDKKVDNSLDYIDVDVPKTEPDHFENSVQQVELTPINEW